MRKENFEVSLSLPWLIGIVGTIVFFLVFVKVSFVFGSTTTARASAARLPSETRELFVECLRIHPRTADVVLLARSPVDACLEASQTLTSTTP